MNMMKNGKTMMSAVYKKSATYGLYVADFLSDSFGVSAFAVHISFKVAHFFFTALLEL